MADYLVDSKILLYYSNNNNAQGRGHQQDENNLC